jgi:F-type H+-transporting ATPase subunit b
MLHDAEFWVAASFVIFLGIVWWMGGFGAFTQGLDSRGKRIQAELDEARRLREDAARVLEDYKRRQAEAEREAEAIVAGAREDAERIAREGHQRVEDFVARRTAAAETKIAQAEAQAAADVRAAAAEAAVRISETVLRDQLKGERADAFLAKSLSEVRGKLQ